MSVRKPASFAILVFGCALVLLGNAQCGEYLLLHYLTSADGPFGKALEQAATPEKSASTQPAAAAENESATTPATQEPANPASNPAPSTPAANCLDGDLNKDGKVDGLDIQILVDCLLKQ